MPSVAGYFAGIDSRRRFISVVWALDPNFNAADELLRDTALKDVLKAAIDKGCAVVPAQLPSVLGSRD